MKVPQYITQLSRKDLDEIAKVANIKAGFLIKIEPSEDGLKVMIDETNLKIALYAFLRNGGQAARSVGEALQIPLTPPVN